MLRRIQQQNALAALKLGIIDWFIYLELMRTI